jgi:Flp pilus assembly protein protease CpaA
LFTGSGTAFSSLLQDMMNLYGNYYVVAILTLFLGIATYTDMKYLKIPNKLNLTFAVIGLALIPMFDFSWGELFSKFGGSLFGFVALLIPAMIRNHKMGGDIKAMAVLGLYLGIFIVPLFMALASVSGVVYLYTRFQTGKLLGNFPFAPFFLVAHIILFIFSFFIPTL